MPLALYNRHYTAIQVLPCQKGEMTPVTYAMPNPMGDRPWHKLGVDGFGTPIWAPIRFPVIAMSPRRTRFPIYCYYERCIRLHGLGDQYPLLFLRILVLPFSLLCSFQRDFYPSAFFRCLDLFSLLHCYAICYRDFPATVYLDFIASFDALGLIHGFAFRCKPKGDQT